jgi:hypothetical protein
MQMGEDANNTPALPNTKSNVLFTNISFFRFFKAAVLQGYANFVIRAGGTPYTII